MVTSHSIFASIIKGNGHKLTATRLAIFESLSEHDSMLMAELVESLKQACDRASIYRTIELFESLNIIKKVAIGWKYRIELSDIFRGHHHHAVCLSCDRVIDFSETSAFETALRQLAASFDFTITDHSLELRGRCTQCRQQTIA